MSCNGYISRCLFSKFWKAHFWNSRSFLSTSWPLKSSLSKGVKKCQRHRKKCMRHAAPRGLAPKYEHPAFTVSSWRSDCLHRQERKYVVRYVAICRNPTALKRKRLLAEAQRKGTPHWFWCALRCQKQKVCGSRRRNRQQRGRIHSIVPPRAEYADSKSRELAQVGCECGGCQRGAEAVSVKLRCRSSHGLGCVFAGTGVKTVFQNKNHSWWGGEPHNTPIGETKNFTRN